MLFQDGKDGMMILMVWEGEGYVSFKTRCADTSKKEKEVFQLVRLFLFTFILSAVLMGLPDYIWNMHLYRISLIVVPWLIAVPSIVYCIKQRVQLVNKNGFLILELV